MTRLGYFLASEEHTGPELVEGAVLAERAGFETVAISDHFHPWLRAQGQSPFVWSVLGAIAHATGRVDVVTAVVCPTITDSSRHRGSGHRHDSAALRRPVPLRGWQWRGAQRARHRRAVAGHRGAARDARRSDADHPRALGRRDGRPPRPSLRRRERAVVHGPRRAPASGDVRVRAEGGRLGRAHRRRVLRGVARSQDLPTTDHFEQIAATVTEDQIRQQWCCGPDPDRHVAAIQAYVDAGFDEVHVMQMGPHQAGMIDFYRREVLPRFA